VSFFMRFKQLLHPEVILNRRGLQGSREVYNFFLQRSKQGEEYLVRYWNGLPEFEREQIQYHLTMCNYFLTNNSVVYHFNKDFALALSKIKKDIPFHLLPEVFNGFISFPEGVISDEGDSLLGVYVRVAPAEGCPEGKRISKINLSFVAQFKDTVFPTFVNNSLQIDAENGFSQKNYDNVRRVVDGETKMSGPTPQKVLTVINALTYVHSLQPEMFRLKSVTETSKKDRVRSSVENGLVNECTIPVTFVNWGWKKPIVYSVDGTIVEGHFRWQACGQNHADRKLIYISEHERHFSKLEETTGAEP
jgi:hypothetical protein